ncbi:flagellar basal body-associated FliL family protein [Tepidibacillus sp. HK-1]|uniref:flagellar basal body-associated FliL family protein n=1 Tax=Tepidibacillus sp. HK-1 TaxID=1883407 RepID=UPI000853E99A|nr:flagellar basal body-associated FliL family protein [Tepidibacillus sp. HK-1]GBF11609.1 flagellar basal body-associated protein FliL [Tepidibacillus sp. HK-1]
MFKNKLFNMALIIIISITLLSLVAFFLYQYTFRDVKTSASGIVEVPTIDDIVPLTVNVPKINTNLGDSTIIVLEMTLQTDNEKAKVEAEKRMFQIKDRINLLLKNLTSDSFATEEKINQFKSDLMVRLNKILLDGKVISIDITQIFLQS